MGIADVPRATVWEDVRRRMVGWGVREVPYYCRTEISPGPGYGPSPGFVSLDELSYGVVVVFVFKKCLDEDGYAA